MLKVQYGCGLSNPVGWVNYDSTPSLFVRKIPLARIAARSVAAVIRNRSHSVSLILDNIINTKASYGDVVRGLPLATGSVNLLYASHVLEHLPLREFRMALVESLRVLRPAGVFRLVVPNLEHLVLKYLKSDDPQKSINFCLESGLGSEAFQNPLSRLRGDSHWIMFDSATLKNELLAAGFAQVNQAFFGSSGYQEFSDVESLSRWSYPENIGFECIK